MNSDRFFAQIEPLKPLIVERHSSLKQVFVGLPWSTTKRRKAILSRDKVLEMLMRGYSQSILFHQSGNSVLVHRPETGKESFDFPKEINFGEWLIVFGDQLTEDIFDECPEHIIGLGSSMIIDRYQADICVWSHPDNIEWEITFSN